MKKFFILLMVVLMLAGLTFTTFAGNGPGFGGYGGLGNPECPLDCPN